MVRNDSWVIFPLHYREVMYRCSLIPYAVHNTIRTENVRSFGLESHLRWRNPVKYTSQSTDGPMESTFLDYIYSAKNKDNRQNNKNT